MLTARQHGGAGHVRPHVRRRLLPTAGPARRLCTALAGVQHLLLRRRLKEAHKPLRPLPPAGPRPGRAVTWGGWAARPTCTSGPPCDGAAAPCDKVGSRRDGALNHPREVGPLLTVWGVKPVRSRQEPHQASGVLMRSTTFPPSPLRAHRAGQGFSQAELAEVAGLSRETISRLERGETPQLATAHAIAGALGAPIAAIFPPKTRARQAYRAPPTVRPGRADMTKHNPPLRLVGLPAARRLESR